MSSFGERVGAPVGEGVRDWFLVEAMADIALRAGARVMHHYERPEAVLKSDGSPVTRADVEAEDIILSALHVLLPGVPVAAEEAVSRQGSPEIADTFLLVDPLDGTRDFIARNGEFTVNIALVRDRQPALGIVFAPAAGRLWISADRAQAMRVAAGSDLSQARLRRNITVRSCPQAGPVALTSRSHMNAQTEALMRRFVIAETMPVGSSVKFCEIAEGTADLYIRGGRTMEWDTAAGHAILRAAGGDVRKPDGAPFLYGKSDDDFENGDFIAAGDPSLFA